MNWDRYIAVSGYICSSSILYFIWKKMGHFPIDNDNKNSPSSNNKYIQIPDNISF